MKAKVLVQILIIAILGTATVQAQENINREVKKNMRKVKREMRKAKKDIKKNLKDIHMDAINLKNVDFDGFFFDGDFDDYFDDNEVIVFNEGQLDNLEDVLEDLDVNLRNLEFIHEYEPLEDIIELKELEKLKHMDFDMPEMVFEAPNIDIRTPRYYEYRNLISEQGSVLELSKDLEDVSISKDFFFDVKKGAKTLDMNIDGTLESGDLTITVKKPDGDVFQKFQISPLADVDWNQRMALNEEGTSYTGKWTINLTGASATGNYSLRFRAK